MQVSGVSLSYSGVQRPTNNFACFVFVQSKNDGVQIPSHITKDEFSTGLSVILFIPINHLCHQAKSEQPPTKPYKTQTDLFAKSKNNGKKQ